MLLVDPKSSFRAILPDVCDRLDSILSVAVESDVKVAVDEAFPDKLDASTFTAINTRFPELVSDCTSDKMLLNKVLGEACGTDIWRWCNKGKRWIVNAEKLTLAANLFACVAPKPEEAPKRLTEWQFIGAVL